MYERTIAKGLPRENSFLQLPNEALLKFNHYAREIASEARDIGGINEFCLADFCPWWIQYFKINELNPLPEHHLIVAALKNVRSFGKYVMINYPFMGWRRTRSIGNRQYYALDASIETDIDTMVFARDKDEMTHLLHNQKLWNCNAPGFDMSRTSVYKAVNR